MQRSSNVTVFMSMTTRERIIRAAASVFAQAGYRGATTRRIADAAAVNEVTLFRQFGSKDELIQVAIEYVSAAGEFLRLPLEPADPRAELIEWSREQLRHLYRVRSMIRTCMGEGRERPEILSAARERPTRLHMELRGYLLRLQARGLAREDVDVAAAAALLMGALFADAMGRDFMPDVFAVSIEEAPVLYVDLLFRGIGGAG
jgi:AcrR family transcriptional regulator